MSGRDVRSERTGWRDAQFSLRHHDWGWDCPAVDIDFLMVEYDNGEPRAIIEYKHEDAVEQTSKHPSYKAIGKLADGGGIPFFAVRYADDLSWWIIAGINDRARAILGGVYLRLFAEVEYVEFLYEKVRMRPFPVDLKADLIAHPFVRASTYLG